MTVGKSSYGDNIQENKKKLVKSRNLGKFPQWPLLTMEETAENWSRASDLVGLEEKTKVQSPLRNPTTLQGTALWGFVLLEWRWSTNKPIITGTEWKLKSSDMELKYPGLLAYVTKVRSLNKYYLDEAIITLGFKLFIYIFFIYNVWYRIKHNGQKRKSEP